MLNRREFLQKALFSAGLLSVSDAFAEGMVERNEAIKISILLAVFLRSFALFSFYRKHIYLRNNLTCLN